jgi:hypothetical protein
MEHWWIVWQMSKIKQKELLQEAARFRLLQSDSRRSDRSRQRVRPSRARSQPLLLALRRNLGRRLIDWGTLLCQYQALHRVDGAQAKRS